MGNALFPMLADSEPSPSGAFVFTHKMCNHDFESDHPLQHGWFWIPLDLWTMQLAHAVHVDVRTVERAPRVEVGTKGWH